MKRMTNAPKAARFAVQCQRYYLGQRQGAPGGYSHGLSLAAAIEIDTAVRESLVAAGISVRPQWQPANDYQAERWRDAYRVRGLAA